MRIKKISLLLSCLFIVGCSNTASVIKDVKLNISFSPLYKEVPNIDLLNHSLKIVTSSDPESFTALEKDAWAMEDVILYNKNNSLSGELITIKTKEKILILQESKSWYYIEYKDSKGYTLKSESNISFTDPNPKVYVKPAVPNNMQNIINITNRASNDFYPDSGEVVATIKIPSVNLYKPVYYGDSQSNIDNYDICIRSFHQFGANMTSILGGHNYKSFGSLQYVKVGDIINVHSYYGDFNYRVSRSQYGTTDGHNIYDQQNNPIIDMYSRDKRIALYTCHSSDPSGRWVLIAEQI